MIEDFVIIIITFKIFEIKKEIFFKLIKKTNKNEEDGCFRKRIN